MSTNDAEPATPGIICPECNHANRASARFCSKCGTDLSEQTIIVAPVRRDQPPPAAPASDAVQQPAAPAPDVAAPTADPLGAASTANRSKPWLAIVVAALVLIAAGAWWFVGANRPAEIGAPKKPLPDPAPAASVAVPPTPAPAPATTASAPGSEPTTTSETASAAAAAPPDADAQRARAAQAREKAELAAKAKAARDAKAKALQEQQAAEQEAARKRADEARARAAQPSAPKPAPAQIATPRTAQEICSGRNAISQAVCASLECGKPEHAGEPYCKQVKAAEDRRSGAP